MNAWAKVPDQQNPFILQGQDPETIALLAIRSVQTEYSPQGDAALTGATDLLYPRLVMATGPMMDQGVSPSTIEGNSVLGRPEMRLFSEMMARPSLFPSGSSPKFANTRVEFDTVL